MHTVKAREDIKEAYFNYNIRHFAIDTKDELLKILEATKNAKDLYLYVRIAISNEHAEIDLSRKFGISPSESLGLVRLCKQFSKKIASNCKLQCALQICNAHCKLWQIAMGESLCYPISLAPHPNPTTLSAVPNRKRTKSREEEIRSLLLWCQD